MKKTQVYISIVIVAFCIVAIGGIATYFIARSNSGSTSHTSHETTMDNGRSETYKKYSELKGEAYDKEFVANMIVHHESAMNMAELALGAASHSEIKDLASNINASQGKEVGAMRDWQKQWGYPAESGHNMTGMAEAGDSMEGMANMNTELEGLSGETFDKKFLELMIEHHQGAIDMAESATANAFHQEVKDLAKAIITAQTKEINQMKMWQKSWGYTY